MWGFRLSGWQRIGIILSVLWIPVGWVLAVKNVPGPPSLDYPLSQICQDAQARMPKRYAPWFVLAPIPIAWLLVYIVVWIVRWVRRGFQPAS
jgi:hypothetical protein